MNILIITAHPSSHGFTHKIAEHYKKGAEKAKHEVEVLDLYKTKLKQGFLDFENIREMDPPPHLKAIQEKIAWANQLVFIFPLWWFNYPAILKNFLDQNLTPGFAYKFRKTPRGRKTLDRLLKGKTARVFVTCDSPSWFFHLIMTPKISLRWGTLFFCGIWTKSWTFFGNMRKTGKEKRKKWLAKVERMGEG